MTRLEEEVEERQPRVYKSSAKVTCDCGCVMSKKKNRFLLQSSKDPTTNTKTTVTTATTTTTTAREASHVNRTWTKAVLEKRGTTVF